MAWEHADPMTPVKLPKFICLFYLWLKMSLVPNSFTWCVIQSDQRLPPHSILSSKTELLK